MLDTSPRSMDWETSSYISTITWVTVRKAAAAEKPPRRQPCKEQTNGLVGGDVDQVTLHHIQGRLREHRLELVDEAHHIDVHQA